MEQPQLPDFARYLHRHTPSSGRLGAAGGSVRTPFFHHRLNTVHTMPASSARLGLLRPAFSRRAALPVAALCLSALLGSGAWRPVHAEGRPQLQLPRTELRAGMYRIDAQVAQTFGERQTGLMHREQMPAHEGMLFVFEQPARQCFWMKNTLLPLTAAFVDDDGTIVNLADMQPQSEASHCSAKPVRYVLEMNQGWFAQKNLKPGAKLTGRPFTSR